MEPYGDARGSTSGMRCTLSFGQRLANRRDSVVAQSGSN